MSGGKFSESSNILQSVKKSLQQQTSPDVNNENSATNKDTEQLFEVDKANQVGLSFASVNYINSIVGSGIIGIPYALQQAGFGLGIVLLAVVAFVTDYSLRLMVRSAHVSGSFSYAGIMDAAFGTPGYFFLSFLQFVYPFIAMVSYNVVVGDTVTKVLIRMFGLYPSALLAHRNFVVFLATVSVTIPLCLQKDMAGLSKASTVSIAFVVFLFVTIFIRFFSLFSVVPPTYNAFQFSNNGVVPAIGIMAFAFMCHHNVFLLYSSVRNASQERWDKITHISVFSSFLITLAFGLVGYGTFAGFVQGDLLENYCWSDDLMNLARIVYSITILLTFPIECLVSRAVVEGFVGTLDTPTRHRVVTFAIVLAAYLLSVGTDCLGLVLELNGVLAAVPLAFVLPAATYLRLWPGPLLSRDKLPALGLALFGVSVALTGFWMMIANFDQIGKCSHGRIMPYCNTTDHY